MKYDTVGQCFVAEPEDTLEGWTILHREKFKPGVERLHIRAVARQPYEFRIVYRRKRRQGGEVKR